MLKQVTRGAATALLATLALIGLMLTPAHAGNSFAIGATVNKGTVVKTTTWSGHKAGTMVGTFHVTCAADNNGKRATQMLVAVYEQKRVTTGDGVYAWVTKHHANRYPPCTGSKGVTVVVPGMKGGSKYRHFFQLRNTNNKGRTVVSTSNLRIE